MTSGTYTDNNESQLYTQSFIPVESLSFLVEKKYGRNLHYNTLYIHKLEPKEIKAQTKKNSLPIYM